MAASQSERSPTGLASIAGKNALAEHDRDLEKGWQAQAEPLDPNFDKVDALLKAANLTIMRVLQASPQVKTARDAKALLDTAITAMKLAEMLRATQRTPEDDEERRNRMWALIDQITDIKRSQFEAVQNKGLPTPGPPTRQSDEDGADCEAAE